MADPYRGKILEELKRDQLHSQDIHAALKYLCESLGREGIPFGLIGALALRHHGYTRFTEDIDILITPEGLEKIHDRLVGPGILPRGTGLKKNLWVTASKVKLDVAISGEHAGSDESPILFPSPASAAFQDQEGLRVVTLEKLIELKITSGIWGHRARDFGDVQELIRSNGLTEEFVEKLASPVRARYLELLGESRLQRDLEG